MAIIAETFVRGARRDSIQLALESIVPSILWRLYVAWILFPDWKGQAFWFDPHVVGWPFAGIGQLWAAIFRGAYFPAYSDVSRAGVVFSVLVISAFALSMSASIRKPGAVVVAAVVYAVMAISFTYDQVWVHVGNAQRGTYELFVALALTSVGLRSGSRTLQPGLYAFWLATAVYVFFLAYDADRIRGAVMAAAQ